MGHDSSGRGLRSTVGLILNKVIDALLNETSSCEALEGASRGAYIVAISAEAGEYGLPFSDSSLMPFHPQLSLFCVCMLSTNVFNG